MTLKTNEVIWGEKKRKKKKVRKKNPIKKGSEKHALKITDGV